MLLLSRTMAARIDLARAISALVIVCLPAACGGKTQKEGVIKSETGEDSGVRTTDSGLGTRAMDGGSGCADLEVNPSDLSCGTDHDCALVRTGQVCNGECDLFCGDTPVNTVAAMRFESDTGSLTLGPCPCNLAGEVRCLGGQCTLCALGPNQPAGCSDAGLPTPTDASGESGDASDGEADAGDAADDGEANASNAVVADKEAGEPGPCVDAGPRATCQDADISASNYDQTCLADSDCVIVGEGPECSPCALAYGPFAAINRAAVQEFEADVNRILGGIFPVSCAPACTPSPAVCCRGGSCHADSTCVGDASPSR